MSTAHTEPPDEHALAAWANEGNPHHEPAPAPRAWAWWEEVSAACPDCGVAHVPVRPGKTQPNCDCAFRCPCGGRVTEHQDDPRWPRLNGFWCDTCGPFGEGAGTGAAGTKMV